jgi:HAD superfamily hydrolase (TIGR01490 family)
MPARPDKLALFDLDNTLLYGDSDHAWGDFLVDEGAVDRDEFRAKNDAFYLAYKTGTLDIHDYLRFALSPIAGKRDEDLKPLVDRFMKAKVVPMIHDAAWPLLDRHQHDLCAIVTATNAFVTAPIAAHLGVAHLIACDVEKIDGRYTGQSVGVPSFREGKILRVEQWLAQDGRALRDFDETYFYSDSLNDLPLLNLVTHPVAVDPDPTLLAHAEARGWPIISLRKPASTMSPARNVAAQSR